LQFGQFFLQSLDLLFDFRDILITNPCNLFDVTAAQCTFVLEFQVLDISFPRLDLFNKILLRMPFCIQPVSFLGQVGDLLIQAL
jgi:hypothetical protein